MFVVVVTFVDGSSVTTECTELDPAIRLATVIDRSMVSANKIALACTVHDGRVHYMQVGPNTFGTLVEVARG